MKLNVRFQNEWFVIPIKCDNEKIEWLIEETIQRYFLYASEKRKQLKTEVDYELHNGLNGHNNAINNNLDENKFNQLIANVIEIRKNSTNAILNRNDKIDDVLNDDDFLCISKFIFKKIELFLLY